MSSTDLLDRIERHLARTSIAPARLGRDAVGDPRLVFDLRKGRRLRRTTYARIDAFLCANEGACERQERSARQYSMTLTT